MTLKLNTTLSYQNTASDWNTDYPFAYAIENGMFQFSPLRGAMRSGVMHLGEENATPEDLLKLIASEGLGLNSYAVKLDIGERTEPKDISNEELKALINAKVPFKLTTWWYKKGQCKPRFVFDLTAKPKRKAPAKKRLSLKK